MTALELGVDLSPFVDALASGNNEQIIAVAREHLQHDESASVLIGRIGLLAAQGDSEGHTLITLAAAAMLSRLLFTIPAPLDADSSKPSEERALPLFVQALLVAAPAVRAGHTLKPVYPTPLFPSELLDTGRTVNDVMRDAVLKNDRELVERALFGLYGTGADYRTLQVRAYESISTTFQDAGHPLIDAVRGFQLLDAVEWGDRVPTIIHWLAPHLPLRPDAEDPDWVRTVRNYASDHSLAGIRTRLSAPKDANALALRQLVLSDADTTQVCQAIYDTVIKGEASPRAVGSVIALAAADVLNMVGDDNREQFVRAGHGLLFSAAARLVFRQVQDVEVLPLLYTSAAYVNVLRKEIASQMGNAQAPAPATTATPTGATGLGGGFIAAAQLDSLAAQLKAQDLQAAATTAHRYLKLGHDPRALFGTIGLVAAATDALADHGHTLQIVQAAAEEFLAWPGKLSETNIEGFLHIALRAAAFGQRNSVVENL